MLAPPAAATLRTATYTWTPATGPVTGYALFASVDGDAEALLAYVDQPTAQITVDPGASLIVSVAAYDAMGRTGPRSNASVPLRLCPGDFDGNEVIDSSDVLNVRACLFHAATGDCAGADLNDDGIVNSSDYAAVELGADACSGFDAGPVCAGDMDGDGSISAVDVIAVYRCVGLQPLGNCALADLDGSGFVSTNDYLTVSRLRFTETCAP